MTYPIDQSGAKSDAHLVELWLLGRAEQTERSYRADAVKFLAAVGKPIYTLTVADVGEWTNTLTGTDQYKARRLISIKSLLRFAHATGYHAFNVGIVLRIPRLKRRTHTRIMKDTVARDMIDAAKPGRDRALLRLFLASGCRVSEAVGVNFSDLGDGHITFYGKGGKTRTVKVVQHVIDELKTLRKPEDVPESPVFKTKRGARLTVRTAQRITEGARTENEASPHWFRHCHATTALLNGADLHSVKGQLGHNNISTTDLYLGLVGKNGGSGDYVEV
jgi:integrase/recombinase XerD